MDARFLVEGDLSGFVSSLMADRKVIGPMAKKKEFVFSELEASEDLRLDYDVTILPPKKAIMPTTQTLVEFTPDGAVSALRPTPQILFGVHFYDIKAIDQLDQLFSENHKDNNYLAYREQTTIVGSSIQNVAKRAFFGSVGRDVAAQGHDAFLTKIEGGYLFETLTEKGTGLLSFGSFSEASTAQIEEARNVNEDVLKQCSEELSWSSEEIAEKVRASYGNQGLWEDLSKQCFSCGTCNITCPTCYCFDVQDAWNLDQVSGERKRTWDGCQLHDFAVISHGNHSYKNFRTSIASRYRHRMMRKATYLNSTLGGPACVGCGRCSVGCVPDIADPVAIISRIMEGK